MNIQMMDSLEPYALALFTRVLNWQPERLFALLSRVRADLRNLNYHMYSVVYAVTSISGYSKLLLIGFDI